MLASEFDYHLPPELIAQLPAERRDGSRLLVVERAGGRISHRAFGDLPELLNAGDLLALNDTRVYPARLRGLRAATGGKVEALFLREEAPGRWLALTRSGGKLAPGDELVLAGGELRARVIERRGEGVDLLGLPEDVDLHGFLSKNGEVPLPPYIRREDRDLDALDRERYQTIYAAERGAVAAPTAGLHFTPEVFERLEARGVGRAQLTLHVGPGTFRPVKAERVEDHRMHAEWYRLGEESARRMNRARAAGGRLVAVGTTVVRVLESAATPDGELRPEEGWTDIFIRPPYELRATDGLLTNFHLPRSTLLMLVAAFAGRELVLEAYRQAVREGYRFYSYGDACLFV